MVEVTYEEDYFLHGNAFGGYEGYSDFPVHADRVKKIIDIANPKSVLDVGCAYGYIVHRFLDLGIHAIGMDISEWCEKQAQKIIPDHFIRHDVRQRLPFKYKEFDVLYCEGVLEHIETEYIGDIMREFERVSNKRILALSFDYHPNAKETAGHLCLKDHNWWFAMMPYHTWLFLGNTAIEGGNQWFYKG